MITTFLLLLSGLLLHTPVLAKKHIYLACIDCYSTAATYPQEAKKLFPDHEITWIHVKSKGETPDTYKRSENDTKEEYKITISFDPLDPEDVKKTALLLKEEFGIRYAIDGMEQGAFHADAINAYLDGPGNSVATRELRKVKAKQQKALGKPYAIDTLLSGDLSEINQFLSTADSDEVVLKPNNSSGSDFLAIVQNDRKTVEAVILSMLGQSTIYEEVMDKVIVQPRVIGEEYVANTFNFDGQTILMAVWRYYKIQVGDNLIYFADRPLHLDSDIAMSLEEPNRVVNERLENRWGPGHSEWIRQPDGSWKLIEHAARVAGSGMPLIDKQVWGTSHLHWNLLLAVDPERLAKEIKEFTKTRRRKLKEAAVHSLASSGVGHFRKGAAKKLSSLRSYFPVADFYKAQDGEAVETTDSLVSSPVTINLVNPSVEVLKQDSLKLMQMQLDGTLFKYKLTSRCSAAIRRWFLGKQMNQVFKSIDWK